MNTPFIVSERTKFYLIEDSFNQSRAETLYGVIREKLPLTSNPSEADCFIVIGGDGSMLQAVRHPERNGLPILALNGGTVGKTLVDANNIDLLIEKLMTGKCYLMQFPTINVEAQGVSGETRVFSAFNDVWADRLSARSVRYNMTLIYSGEHPFEFKLGENFTSGDGILACTPAGCTGYARMLGEMVLPLSANNMLITPMASMVNKSKVHAFAINDDQSLVVDFQDYDFRPVRLAVDGVYIEDGSGHFCIKSMKITMDCQSKNAVFLVVDDLNSFRKKQADFIAR